MGDSGIDTKDALDAVGLPFTLFDPGQYPVGRVNVYSRPDLLTFVYEQLRDTEDWEEIRRSSFGNLFNLPVTRCYISCKLIHNLLSRQLVTKRRYELWSVFGSQPMRFSLSEFEAVTNLNCLPFPDNYDPDSDTDPFMGKGSVWETFIGENKNARISDLMVLLRQRKGLSGWRRVGLALLLIVDGVVIANKQGDKRLTPKYVDMLGNREAFLNFPWGRESFLKTISSMIPTRLHSSRKGGCVRAMQEQLRQVSISQKGFPLALQLLAFKVIPALEERIPNSKDTRTIIEVGFQAHANNAALTQNSFDEVEENTEVSVQPLVKVLRRLHSGLLWVDEVENTS